MEERYETFINKRKYTFAVKFDGHIWIARAFYNGHWKPCQLDVHSNAEGAALKLVSKIERKYK